MARSDRFTEAGGRMVEVLEERRLLSATPHVAAAGSSVAGQSLAEWTADWWRWAFETPTGQNPLADTTGANAGVNQPKNVFFLAGNFGGTTVRTVTIPTGTRVFFPVLNYVAFEEGTVEEMRAAAAASVADPREMHATVDGAPVGGDILSHREISPVFDIELPADNIIGLPPRVYEPAVSDGYWLMLSPLKPGEHTINFGGTGNDGSFTLDVTYDVEVVPKGQYRKGDDAPAASQKPSAFGDKRIGRLAEDVLAAD